MTHARRELVAWLHQLDSYTNAAYGRARTLSAIRQECVACGRRSAAVDERGLCLRCAAQSIADQTTPSRL